jgi:hypothetical protein
MSEVGHNDIDFPPNQLLNCSCNTLRQLLANDDIAASRVGSYPLLDAPDDGRLVATRI